MKRKKKIKTKDKLKNQSYYGKSANQEGSEGKRNVGTIKHLENTQ